MLCLLNCCTAVVDVKNEVQVLLISILKARLLDLHDFRQHYVIYLSRTDVRTERVETTNRRRWTERAETDGLFYYQSGTHACYFSRTLLRPLIPERTDQFKL